jgi:hypothetical protein
MLQPDFILGAWTHVITLPEISLKTALLRSILSIQLNDLFTKNVSQELFERHTMKFLDDSAEYSTG